MIVVELARQRSSAGALRKWLDTLAMVVTPIANASHEPHTLSPWFPVALFGRPIGGPRTRR